MRKYKIMVVDNSEEILEHLRLELTLAGYDVVTVNESPIALPKASLESPDIILVDLRMENLNGFQLALKLKQFVKTKDIPIIAMSGHYDKEKYPGMLARCGIETFFEKPINMPELLLKIQALLKGRDEIISVIPDNLINKIDRDNKGFALIEMVIVIVIIGIISYFLIKTYFKGSQVDKQTEQSVKEQGMNPNNYTSIMKNSRAKVNEFNKSYQEREKQLEKVKDEN